MNLESAWWHAYNQQSKNEAICWRMSHLPRQGCISEQQLPLPPLIMNTPPAAADGQSSSFRLWPLARPGALPSDRTSPLLRGGEAQLPKIAKRAQEGKGTRAFLFCWQMAGSAAWPTIPGSFCPLLATHHLLRSQRPQAPGRSVRRVSGVETKFRLSVGRGHHRSQGLSAGCGQLVALWIIDVLLEQVVPAQPRPHLEVWRGHLR